MEAKGYVDHIIYRKPENGYTVFVLSTKEEDITCVGYLQQIDQGETLLVQGEIVEHSLYGSQIKVKSYQVVLPDDLQSMERYLGSGAIKGVGPALAKRILSRFGEDTFRIIEEEPERLTEIKGISERSAREISGQMEEKKEMRQAMIFLKKYGISHAMAVKIYETYGAATYQMIRENPYRLAEDIHGIGFKMADELAARMGIRTDSDFRIRSGILYTLLLASLEGHVYLPKDILLTNTGLMLQIEPELIESQLSNLAMDKKVVIKTDGENIFIYATVYYYAELNCARMLHQLSGAMEEWLPSEEAARKKQLEKFARQQGLELDELQMEAVARAIQNGLFILSGGPGTGKTTTILLPRCRKTR